MFSRVIFALAVLLSSSLVNNSMSTISNDALEKLQYPSSFIEKLMRMETNWISLPCGWVVFVEQWGSRAKENVYSHFYEENVGIVGRNFFSLNKSLAMCQSSQKSPEASPLQIGWSRKFQSLWISFQTLSGLYGISPWSWRYMFILSQKMSTWIMPWSWLEVSEHDLGNWVVK